MSSYDIIAIFYCNEDLYLRAPSFNIFMWHMDKLVLIKYCCEGPGGFVFKALILRNSMIHFICRAVVAESCGWLR